MSDRGRLGELGRVFLMLGLTAFGGPVAHVALMRRELVEKRGWLDQQTFLDLYGVTQLIPGPNSTELAIHIGKLRGGWPGLLIAGSAFILPAGLIVGMLAALYVAYGTMPALAGALYGIKPVIVAIVAEAAWSFAKTAAKNTVTRIVAAGSGVLSFLFGAPALMAPLAAPAAGVPATLGAIFLFFVKVGSVLFGSGYVLLAFLRADLVERWRWLTEAQLLDAIAIGQFTPGPVFTTATFVGYLLAGAAGAVVATVGIFLPAFVFVALTAPIVAKIRSSKRLAVLLDVVNAASWAMMVVVLVRLGQVALVSPLTIGLAVVGLGLLVRFKINSAWLVLAGGVVGFLAEYFRLVAV